ncbi:hypothetical protein [Micromonospora coxensis]|uniref:hypothetical protein n=1 Tax=Micromonospora coxensis TaxID=356852 RepID=UPI003440A00C
MSPPVVINGRDVAPALLRLVVARTDDGWVLGRPDLNLYVAVPEPGAVLIEALRETGSLTVATARACTVAGVDVDGADFVEGLLRVGLLAPPAESGPEPGRPRTREVRWIHTVSPRTARRLFGPTAWSVYTTAALTCVGLLAAVPALRPTYENAWFLTDPVLSVLAYLPIAVVLGAAHEAWHWLAGRAIGVPARFRVSYRGIYLVFETDLTQLVTRPRRQRYGPFLAGMAFDCCMLVVALLARLAYQRGVLALPPTLYRVLGAVVLFTILAIVWQWAALFARSDGYAVLANLLRCHDLHRATWLTTKRRIWRLSDDEQRELDETSRHDRAVARWFGLVSILGIVTMAWVMLTYRVPFLVLMGAWLLTNLQQFSLTRSTLEAAVMVLYLLAVYLGPVALAVRERAMRRSGSLR